MCPLKFLLLLVRDVSFDIHEEISDEIVVKYVIPSVTTFHEVYFRHLTGKGIEFDNKTLRAKYMYVQHIAGCENSDDMSVAKEICSTVIQKRITEIR